MIKRTLADVHSLFSDYTELRLQENRDFRITLVNGSLMGNSRSSNGGVSARVFRNGSWGFASHPERTDDAIRRVVASASENARFLDSRLRRTARTLAAVSGETDRNFATTRPRVSQKEMIDFVREIDEYIARQHPRMISRTVVIAGLDMEKYLVNSERSQAYSLTPRSLLYVSLATEKDGQPADLYEVFGGFGHFEDHDWSRAPLFQKIDLLAKRLLDKSEGVFPRGGMAECVLDADLAGILAHEAIGHTTEADMVLGGSIAGEFLDKEVASPLVTLVDYANTAQGKLCPVPIYIDDEGTPAADAVVIEKGVLKGFMHNKDTAEHFGVAPTGNARAYRFSDEPLVRMRNTAFVPGTSKLEEMIAGVKDGYYLVKSGNGQADSTSEFMFGITLGYEIKEGKIGRALRDTTISGVAFDVLKTVTMVSDEMLWSCGGMCGKKQMIPVGMGGPAIKCRLNIGGRA
jgi:TldD protein